MLIKTALCLSILSSILFSQVQDKFIIGAEHVSAMNEFNGCQLPHPQEFWDFIQEFGLNYISLKYYQYFSPGIGVIPKSEIINELDSADDNNLKVLLFNGFDRDQNGQFFPKRWLYQVEKVTGNELNDFLNVPTGRSDLFGDAEALTHWNLTPPEDGTPNFLRLVPGTDSYGLVASDLREKNLQPDGLNYYLKIKMRLPTALNFTNTDIITVRVLKAGGSMREWTIKANEFIDNNWKEIDLLCFNKTANGPVDCIPSIDETTVYDFPDSICANQVPAYIIKSGVQNTDFDIEIEWHNTGFTVDIDYVAIDDEDGQALFTHQWDNRIDDAVSSEYRDHPSILNIFAHDEVTNADLFPTRYVKERMQTSLSINRTPFSYHYFSKNPYVFTPQTKRYLWETGMDNLVSDIYPLDASSIIPGGAGYTEDIQSRFQNDLIQTYYNGIDGGLKKLITTAAQFEKPFWFTVQAHKWVGLQREPSAYEIKAMANLGICYGAKGIIYYLYSNPSTDPTVLGFYHSDINQPRYIDEYGYPKWNTIKNYNNNLSLISYELMSLTWEGAASINLQDPIPYPYITSVNALYNSVPDPDNSTYVELGFFKITDDLSNDKIEYFFVVNRRTLPDESRTIRVNIDKSEVGNWNNWGIKEIGTDNSWTIGETGQFETGYDPGEGKLFRLEPVVLGGGRLTNNETIGNNIELHGDLYIEDNASLTVNSIYDCYGNIYLKNGSHLYGSGTINFHDGKQLIVSGIPTVVWGTSPTSKLTIDFVFTGNYSGIFVGSNGYLSMENTVVRNSGVGLYTDRNFNYVSLVMVDFNNCGDEYYCASFAGPSTHWPWIYACTFNNCYGAVLATNLSEIVIQNNQITNCDAGINLSNVPQPHIIGNILTSVKKTMPGIFLSSCNGLIRSNFINGHTNGIHLANSSPDIGGNYIDNNLYHGIYIGSGSLPDMHAELFTDDPAYYAISGYNTIIENGGFTTGSPPDNDGSEIFFGSTNANANLREGCNTIADNREPGGDRPPYNTKLLMNSSPSIVPITVHAESNYWSENPIYPLDKRFGNLRVYFEPILTDPCEYSEGGNSLLVKTSTGDVVDTIRSVEKSVEVLSNTDILYSIAEEKFISADYAGAEQIYNQVISSNDTLFAKLLAYQRSYEIGKITSKPQNYFDDLYNALSEAGEYTEDSVLQKRFIQLASLSLIGEGSYIPAIEEFDNVIQQNQGTEEAVYAEIDALTAALLIEPGDTSLGKTAAAKYMIKSIDYGKRIDQLLKNNFGKKNEIEELAIPTEYSLYNNYPNPFNPTTVISFDIPERIEVELVVYDILGRRIKSLISNEVYNPGRYEVSFNANSLASGVYIYKLTTKNYCQARKMLLVK